MKPKEFSKKLILNKRTVSDLNGNEMRNVKGGCDVTHPNSCPSFKTFCGDTVELCECVIPVPTVFC